MIYWSNIIFPTIGFFAGYYYLYTSEVFLNNPYPSVTASGGYLGLKCHTNTIVWLLINIPFITNIYVIYRSAPFKCKIYENLPILALTIVNAALAILFFFITSKLSNAFGLIEIPAYQSGIVLLIMGISAIASYIFNEVFKRCYIQ